MERLTDAKDDLVYLVHFLNQQSNFDGNKVKAIHDSLAAYEDTGLTPEEINKIVSGAPTKVSFDIGDDGFLIAINAAFKERYGVTADEFEGIIAERDTLKKALELACEHDESLNYGSTPDELVEHYIKHAQGGRNEQHIALAEP